MMASTSLTCDLWVLVVITIQAVYYSIPKKVQKLEVKINFEFKKGVGIIIKGRETSS